VKMINHLQPQEAYEQAVSLFKKREFGSAIPYFLHAIRKTAKDSHLANEYNSYYGLCLMALGNKDEGYSKCIIAAETELNNPEVFVILAKAAMILDRRKMALTAISQGLAIDANYTQLRVLRNELGIRKAPILHFLSRNNVLNILLGKLRYKFTHS